jgi:CheY-like chemotaxis protein
MPNQKYTILIIDDDKIFLKVMHDWFNTKGCEVISMSDGKAAIKLMESTKIDVVLTDVIMDGLTGFDVLAKIKGDEKTKNIPVFLLSQIGATENIDMAKDMGAEDYLVKSNFSLQDLAERIEKVLKK